MPDISSADGQPITVSQGISGTIVTSDIPAVAMCQVVTGGTILTGAGVYKASTVQWDSAAGAWNTFIFPISLKEASGAVLTGGGIYVGVEQGWDYNNGSQPMYATTWLPRMPISITCTGGNLVVTYSM